MKNVKYKVPLDGLYKVVASCNYTDSCDFSPVLLRIMCQDLKGMICPDDPEKEYLLQVWTKGGEMVFEKQLADPITNWNITGTVFLFQEFSDHKEVEQPITMVKLYLDKKPVVVNIALPEDFYPADDQVQ